MPDFKRESQCRRKGIWPVAGVDEAGRGPLAGPVTAAAVILDPNNLPIGLDDSKKLKARQRELLYDDILARALSVSVAMSHAFEIDRINIRQATHLAMRNALAGLSLVPAYVLVDGNDLPKGLICPGETIVKGDAASLSIAAASIMAKVTRDRLMQRLDQIHPVYGFARHAGYGTADHLKAIREYGPSPFHRLSFKPLRVDEV